MIKMIRKKAIAIACLLLLLCAVTTRASLPHDSLARFVKNIHVASNLNLQ